MYPFHISLEGLEVRILCKDRNDYDLFVKIIVICSLRKNVVIVTYAVVSNHVHVTILAGSQREADEYANEIKKMYSMYFSRKYADSAVLRGSDAKAQLIDSDWYLRNAIAYDIRNALDNGENIIEYPWTGLRALFRDGKPDEFHQQTRQVSKLSKREKRKLFHTDDDLSHVKWEIDSLGELIPVTICDWRYVEAAFNNDQAYFMKSVGIVNTAEMEHRLVIAPRMMITDEEFLRNANDISERWFKTTIHNLTMEKRIRMISFMHHTQKTTIPQLARIFEIDRETIKRIISK